MTISINEKICENHGITLEELLAVLLVKSVDNLSELFESLVAKNILYKDLFGNYMVTQSWQDLADTILLDSDKELNHDEDLEALAITLMGLFPQGKKEGTNLYYKCNKKDVTLKLKKFLKLYGNYTSEQIIEATKRYVQSFNGNYSYMRVLKYFTWKNEIKMNYEGKRIVEEVSDLANWIENSDTLVNNNWPSTLI